MKSHVGRQRPRSHTHRKWEGGEEREVAVGTPVPPPPTDPDVVVKPSGSYLWYLTLNRCHRPRVADPRLGPVSVHQGLQPLPTEAIPLRPSVQSPQPYPFQDVGEASQEAGACRDGIVVQPSVDDPSQPPRDLVEIVVPAPPQNLRDALRRAAHPLCSGLASEPEPSAPGRPAVVREAQEVERLRAA